jgi:hypothetical protein
MAKASPSRSEPCLLVGPAATRRRRVANRQATWSQAGSLASCLSESPTAVSPPEFCVRAKSEPPSRRFWSPRACQ